MARFKDKQKALELREQGQSYSQIKKVLKVSKGSLSSWLKDHPLSRERIKQLRDWNEQRIEKFRRTMKEKRQKRLDLVYKEQKKFLLPIKNRELFLIGLGLYWGEGSKYRMDNISLSNTNPDIIKFYTHWLIDCLGISKEKMRISLHLYKDMDSKKEISYWSNALKIPKSNFCKPYIKKTSSEFINHKGTFGHGTCNLRIGNSRLSERIFMDLQIIANEYGCKRA